MNKGCWSKVGREGGPQPINLDRNCLTIGGRRKAVGRAKHEIMHAIGFLHEMNRWGRNIFVVLKAKYVILNIK